MIQFMKIHTKKSEISCWTKALHSMQFSITGQQNNKPLDIGRKSNKHKDVLDVFLTSFASLMFCAQGGIAYLEIFSDTANLRLR